MPRYRPSAAEFAAINERVNKAAGEDAPLADNLLFAELYHHEKGLYPRKGKPAVWVKEKSGWVRYKRNLSRREWIEQFFPIRDKHGKIHRITLNPPQRKMLALVLRMERLRMPVRVQILKARQQGYCYSPETRILTADLRWVRIDEISPGAEIVACDERPLKGKGKCRTMLTGVVEAKLEVFAEAFRITLDSGVSVIATGEHRHLCKKRRTTETEWRSVHDTRVGDEIRHITIPWGEATPDDHWYAGIMDGEGHLNIKNNGGVCMGASQLDGRVWDRMLRFARERGYTHRIEVDRRSSGPSSKLGKRPVNKLVIGRMPEVFRLIGQCRPERFIHRRWWEGKALPGKKAGSPWSKVVSIEALGPRRMIDLQTSTKTFIAEGLVSHNSTFVQAFLFEMMMRGEDVRGLIVAHNQDTSSMLLQIAEIGLTRMVKREGTGPRSPDEFWKFKMRSKAKNSLELDAPLFGLTQITSAKTLGAGVGGTRTLIHFSEGSRYEDAESVHSSVLPSLPDLPFTYGFDESTAYGSQGKFHHDFWESWSHEDEPLQDRMGWVAVFCPWFAHSEYRWTASYGHGRELPATRIAEIENTLDSEEKWLLKQKWFRRWSPSDEWVYERRTTRGEPVWRRKGVGWQKVTIDQLAWRRQKMADKMNSADDGTFNQDYPSRPEVAFRSSGSQVFDQDRIDAYEKQAKEIDPLFRGFLHRTDTKDGPPESTNLKLEPHNRGGLTIWENPVPGRQYVVSSDTAGGGAKGDPAVAIVLDAETCDIVALWRELMDPHRWGPKCALLGWLYNEAVLGFETQPSTHGLTAATEALNYGYVRLYYRRRRDSGRRAPTDVLGFHTNVETKPLFINRIKQSIELGHSIPSRELLKELRAQYWDEKGQMASNGHDDMVDAYGIGLLIRDDCYAREIIKPEVKMPVTFEERYWAREKERVEGIESRQKRVARHRRPRWNR